MGANLYPLIFKPGIKLDGTDFQADYCTQGQWVRFQRGFIRKMGGMKGLSNKDNLNDLINVNNITLSPDVTTDSKIVTYIASEKGKILRSSISTDFIVQGAAFSAYDKPLNNIVWKSVIAVQGNNQKIIFLGAPSLDNINTNTPSIILLADLNQETQLMPIAGVPQELLTGASGILFVNPWLFIYGSAGLLAWSKDEDFTNFGNSTDRQIDVSTDKIIDIKVIRGGINSPTLLCWTLSSVVRVINTSQDSENSIVFQRDTLSRSSSILSTRCVVEYDGLFFWPGTNRFFQYNGVVQELANTMNLNYFYNNLDMKYRQMVFGVKNTQYGEIWWFYPKKGQDENVGIINNGAIIYNIRDNAWYNTNISRSAGVYSEDFGFMATYGRSLTTPESPLTLYRHEYETFAPPSVRNSIDEFIPVTGQVNNTPIPIISSFTTPTISWAAFNPMKQLTGTDRWMYVITIEPDFTLLPSVTDMTVTINAKEYAQSTPIQSQPYLIPGLDENDHDSRGDKVDVAFQGRHITFTFNTSDNFEMGQVMLLLGIGDGQ